MRELTAERLRAVLSYNPNTGLFTWIKPSKFHPRMQGQVAGSVGTGGYIHIRVDGKKYRAHRLAWLYVYGLPPYAISHEFRAPKSGRLFPRMGI